MFIISLPHSKVINIHFDLSASQTLCEDIEFWTWNRTPT